MNLAVFAYNFPHIKTNQFLLELFLNKIQVSCVIAADWVKVSIPSSEVRVKIRQEPLNHPKDICERLEYPYYVCDHNSLECIEILNNHHIDIAVIAGARILKANVIASVKKGIINFHPGIIPYVCGLDALKWSIYKDIDLGVTAHFIDYRIDCGRIIHKETISLFQDDTFFDLSARLSQKEVSMLTQVLEMAQIHPPSSFEMVGPDVVRHTVMSYDKELELNHKLAIYLRKRLHGQ